MKDLNKKLFYILVAGLFSLTQAAHATSTFSPTSTVTITIDSIINNTDTGNMSGLSIVGLFEIGNPLTVPGFGETKSGDGDSIPIHTTAGEINSTVNPVNPGDSFSQSFSSIGNVSNGWVDVFYQAIGTIGFVNNSTDSFTIQYSLSYDLNANASGDFATNSVALEYYNDLGDIYGSEETDTSTLLLLTDQALSSESFTLSLAASESDKFFVDVFINGYAEAVAPVPVPAAGWLMLSGLVFLRNYRKLTV